MSDRVLVSVIQQAWISGVSTRKVENIVKSMGLDGISKSQVSQLCKDIDIRVNDFLFRRLEGEWPYLWLDATYLKVREGGRVISVAAIIAVAVNQDDENSALAALREAARRFGDKLPRLEAFLLKSEAAVLAHMTFPVSHHPRISNTNPLERLNKEVKRRSSVVGIFPCEDSILRPLAPSSWNKTTTGSSSAEICQKMAWKNCLRQNYSNKITRYKQSLLPKPAHGFLHHLDGLYHPTLTAHLITSKVLYWSARYWPQ